MGWVLLMVWVGVAPAAASSILFTYAGAGAVALTVGPTVTSLSASNNTITAPSSSDIAIAFGNTSGAQFKSSGPATFTGVVDFSDDITKSTGGICAGGSCKVDFNSSLSNTTITGGTVYNPRIAASAINEWMGLTNTATGWGSVAGVAADLSRGGTLCVGTGGAGCTYTADTPTTMLVNGMMQTAYVFDITSSAGRVNGAVMIRGDGTGNAMVVLNDGGLKKLQTNQAFTLAGGLSEDQVLLNVTSSGGMQTSGGFSFDGAIAITGSTINLDAAVITGRVFLYGTAAASIQSGFDLTAPQDSWVAPEPEGIFLMLGGLLLILLGARRRRHRQPPQ